MVRDLQDQSVDIWKRTLIAGNLAHHEGAHAAKAGQVKAHGLFENEVRDTVGEAAPDVTPWRMTLLIIISIDHLLAVALGELQQALPLLRRVLQVVVHCNDMSTTSVTQPCHYRVVFAIVSREIDERDGDMSFVMQRGAHFN